MRTWKLTLGDVDECRTGWTLSCKLATHMNVHVL